MSPTLQQAMQEVVVAITLGYSTGLGFVILMLASSRRGR